MSVPARVVFGPSKQKASDHVQPIKLPLDKDNYIRSVTFDSDRVMRRLGDVVESIRNRGLCIIKNDLPPSSLRNCLTDLQRWYAHAKDANEDGKNSWALQNGLTAPNIPSIPKPFTEVMGSSCFPHIARAYFGCEPGELVIPENHMLLRARTDYTNSLLVRSNGRHNFHQDYPLIPHSFPMNVWIPLTRIDANCVGLTFLLPFTGQLYELPPDIDQIIKDTCGFMVAPDLEVGDVVFFTHKTLHGSFNPTDTMNPRFSIEFRTGAAEMLEPGYDGIVHRL